MLIGSVQTNPVQPLEQCCEVHAEGGRIDIDCHGDGNSVCISVMDTGVGIRAEDQAVIFEEFRQVEGLPGQTQEGTGLDWRSPSAWSSNKGAEFR